MKHLLKVLAVAAAVAVESCNGDVFTHGTDLPVFSTVTLSPGAPDWAAQFSRRGLVAVDIDVPDRQRQYLSYYDRDGHPVDASCPPSLLGSIVMQTPVLYYSIGFNGDIISVSSITNATGTGKDFVLQLTYDNYVMKGIVFKVSPGNGLQLVSQSATSSLTVKEDVDSMARRTVFTNNSALTQALEFNPYIEDELQVLVESAEEWSYGLELDVSVPFWDGKEWARLMAVGLCMGHRHFMPTAGYADSKIKVSVPPYTKATVDYTLYRSEANEACVLELFNPDSGATAQLPCTVATTCVTRCTYTVHYE